MLNIQILDAKKKDDNSTNNVPSPKSEHSFETSPQLEDVLFLHQFKLPRQSLNRSLQKNRCLLRYNMPKSWTCDATNSGSLQKSPKNCRNFTEMSLRKLSRSAKIMGALSTNQNRFRDKDAKIKKSLDFESTPSPKKDSSYNESSTSSVSVDSSLSILNSSSSDSIGSSILIASAEFIDENQNQTPQQNRKHARMLSYRNPNTKERMCKSRFTLKWLCGVDQEEKPDNITNLKQTPNLLSLISSFKGDNGSNRSGRVITASTPRNLSQEFNQVVHDKPCTSENMMHLIPEGIKDDIKKRLSTMNKKGKLYAEEQSFTKQADVSVENDKLQRWKTLMEFSETDMFANSSCSESQRKNKNIKRTLIYNLDNKSDAGSDSDYSVQQETTSKENDLSMESGLGLIENDKMPDIGSSDCEQHEKSMEISMHLTDEEEKEEDRSKENICNEEVDQLSLQDESSSVPNVNVTNEDRMASPESNPTVSQDTNGVVTPENHINMLKQVVTESIKKSHKKIKQGTRKTLFKTEVLHQKISSTKSEVEDVCNNDQDIENQAADIICASSSQNSDRPSTPENINSSRDLLLHFNSVKKSHKKDKRSKKNPSHAQSCNYEHRKRNSNSLQREIYGEEDICKDSYGIELKESPDILPKKKKKPVSTFLQSSTPKLPSSLKFLGYENIDDEFKIYTPIKKSSARLTVTESVGKMSQDEDEPVQETSKEIDCSRCMTPIARRFRKPSKSDDLISKKCDNTEIFETDVSALDDVSADTANLRDENGRSTPINMSTMELLYNIDSIKKSHKKDKHSHSACRRPIIKNRRSCIEESGHVEREMCSNMREKEKDESYKETAYGDPQPSTSRGGDNGESTENITKSKLLTKTPPNSLGATKLIKLLHTTSIKKSHKKERDCNAQAKYILMNEEHDLSDDGSIFDEKDRLNFTENENNTKSDNIIDQLE